MYDAVLGPLPAIAQRNVWIAVRFDPSQCAEAVRRRGGGREGILRTATTATRRVANRLTEAGLRPRILTASGIAAATNQLSDGVDHRRPSRKRGKRAAKGSSGCAASRSSPRCSPRRALACCGRCPVTRRRCACRCAKTVDHDLIKVRGLARFDSEVGVPVDLPGLIHLRGLQFSALACSLPIPPPTRPVGHWAYGERDVRSAVSWPCRRRDAAKSSAPTRQGRAVALPLFGPQIARVEICGTLHLAQQAVLRSLALGARVLVHSRRPALWRDMVEQVGRHDLLWVADFNRGAIQAGCDRNYSVEMFDGVAERPVRAGVTSIVVAPPNTPVTPNADVALELVSLENDTVKVSTRAGSAVVTMVATDEEMRYLKASANSTD